MTQYYSDEFVTIYHGDCRDVLLEIESADHVITDPPYDRYTHDKHLSEVAEDRSKLTFQSMDAADFEPLCSRLVSASKRWVLMTCDYRHAPKVFDKDYFVRLGVWVKQNGAPQFTGDRPGMGYEPILVLHRKGRKKWNGGGRHAVWHSPIVAGGHPTQKPELLLLSLVSDFTDPGETILDPFMGSGTTLVAAKRLGRKAIGIEIDEQYCQIAAERLRQGTLAELFA